MSKLNPQKKEQKQEEDISSEFGNLSGNRKVASHLLSRGSLHNKGFDSADWSMGTNNLKNVNKKTNSGNNRGRNRGRNETKTRKSGLTVSVIGTENEKKEQTGTRFKKLISKQEKYHHLEMKTINSTKPISTKPYYTVPQVCQKIFAFIST